jgi:preprotein translocase subunit SecF
VLPGEPARRIKVNKDHVGAPLTGTFCRTPVSEGNGPPAICRAMEILTDTKIDFLGRRYYFIGLSVVLMVAGMISLALHGGPRLGIDFKGGTLLYLKFKENPDVGRLRKALEDQGIAVATLQPFAEEGSHELKVDLDLGSEEDLNIGRDKIAETLHSIYPPEAGKLDFNNAGDETLADRLKQRLANSPVSSADIDTAAKALVDFRDAAPQAGIVKDFSELTSVPGVVPDIISALREETYLGDFAIRRVEVVGPKIGRDLQWQAVQATLAALGGMLLYIAFRFEWIYGVAAVVAVFHDVLITVGFFSLFDREIELTVIAALLTLVGYSMNDTIVIFDRVRENRKLTRKQPLETLLNDSVNQTLSRTVLTSGLTFIAVLSLFLFGGEVLRGFSFALVVGVLVGTYSSIFVASPLLLWWQNLVMARSGAQRRTR